jgi:hypothetical protein
LVELLAKQAGADYSKLTIIVSILMRPTPHLRLQLRLHIRAIARCGPFLALLTLLTATSLPGQAAAVVLYARSDIAELTCADCERVEPRDIFLSEGQRERIEKMAGSKLEGDLLTVYEGYRGEKVVRYAVLDTHLVRTLPETLLIVLDGSGALAATYLMAFHEPMEYRPSERWLDVLDNQRLSDDLRVGRAIVGITGATLSARAVVASVRRTLAAYEVLLAGR